MMAQFVHIILAQIYNGTSQFTAQMPIFRVQREHLGRDEVGNHICVELNSSIKNLGRAKVYKYTVQLLIKVEVKSFHGSR